MSVRLFDSATRQVRDFVPLVEGRAGIYVCGATPQASPHIGHLRAGVAFDVLRRWLTRRGYDVTLVRNVTDIDDKILAKSAEAGRPWWAHAFRYEQEFTAAYDTLNVLRPTYEPRATGHMPEMVALVQRLLDAGHAYVAGDGSADVYFDVRSFARYGELTRQGLDDLPTDGDEPATAGKRDQRDFALWKSSKPGEPATASWQTPWGPGRPGWHLECSAMATRYLGAEFDIHGGGLDLRFPHHENELAQSRAAGDEFARYWLHNAWVVAAGEKMSKSLGNVLSLASLTQKARPAVLRYLLSAPHYRSNIEVSPDSLTEATAAFERIEGFLTRADEAAHGLVSGGYPTDVSVLPSAFVEAMDDDLGSPAAVAVVHEHVRLGNSHLAAGDVAEAIAVGLTVRSMLDVLGCDPFDAAWGARGGEDTALKGALDSLVRAELDARQAARKNKDFASADAIRDRLTAAGILVEDTPGGARWTIDTSRLGAGTEGH